MIHTKSFKRCSCSVYNMWMAMENVVMKHLCVVLLSVIIGKAVGHMGTLEYSQPSVQAYEVYEDDDVTGSSNSQPNTVIQDETCSRNRTVPCPCQQGFVRLASGKCYFFSYQERTWQDALASCRGVGTTLAYPLNVVEDTMIANYINATFGTTGWWLGGMDQDLDGNWVWAHNNASITYSYWGPGEPGVYYECLLYSFKWKWAALSCDNECPFVCQQL